MGKLARLPDVFRNPEHPVGKRLKKILRTAFQVVILSFLGYQLYGIGIDNVLSSLPISPLFYLLFLVNYFSLPVFELFIYKKKWSFPARLIFPVFLRKKVLNMDVVGYSGEVYLYMWVKKLLNNGHPSPTPDVNEERNLGPYSDDLSRFTPSAYEPNVGNAKDPFLYIKDNNILSSIASTFVTVVLLFVYIQLGSINPADYIGTISLWNKVFMASVLLLATLLIYRFRSLILSLSVRESLGIFSIHAFRIVFINSIQILQWGVAEPEITLAVWFTFSAVQNLAARIPFLPSTDALFATIALNMTGLVEVPQDMIAGLLTANLILMRGANLLTFLLVKSPETERAS